jgi:hypothetical protein
MFALTPGDLLGKILDCAAGPSSFNAEFTAESHEVTSCDPIYYLTAEEIHAGILATRERMIANVRAAREEFVWHEFISPEHLGEVRMAAMQSRRRRRQTSGRCALSPRVLVFPWQVRVVEGEIGSEELVYDLELALVLGLLDVAADQGFVLYRRTPLPPISRLPSIPAG